MDKCWYDPAIEGFASKARAFYARCEQMSNPIPYEEDVFVATVTIGYQIIQSGEFPIMRTVKAKLKEYDQATGKNVKAYQVETVYRGNEMGRGPCWQWLNYCWEYVRNFCPDRWNAYNDEVTYSETRNKARAVRGIHAMQEDFIILVLAIEYL